MEVREYAIFSGIKNYLADPALAYGYAVTANFKSHLEAVYGSSLTEFFLTIGFTIKVILLMQ